MPALSRHAWELFAQKWHETGSKSEGVRYAYPKSKTWTEPSINVRASKLSTTPEIKARFEELQSITAKRHDITVDSLINELEEARMTALTSETPQSSAAVSATMGKAKLCGLDNHVQKHEHKVQAVDDWGDV